MKVRVFPNPAEIHLLPRLGQAEPVVYAAMERGEGAREVLAARLLEALAGQDPQWTEALKRRPLALDSGPLGQPLLKLGGKPGPGISFSASGDMVWAAISGQGRVGVDAAREPDFQPPYPHSRAFAKKEWDWASRYCQGRTASAAALLWAAKEAAVKALGVGFHTKDPLDLEVARLSPIWEGLGLVVRTPEPVHAWARPLADGWLALAGV